MKTLDLFHDEEGLRECSATLLRVDERGLLLDRTVFYPQGGGQAGDAGVLVLAGGSRIAIVDTRKGEGGEILHLSAEGQKALLAALRPGLLLKASIDWARRHAHMRLHTATHLLCALVPHPVDGCSITAQYARLDFHMNDPLDKAGLNEGLARLIAAAHPVTHRWIAAAELDANPALVRSLRVQPPRSEAEGGRVRVIEIEGVDLQPCGGTHVANTAEIGPVIITKIEKKSAMTRRVVLGFAQPCAA